MFSGLFFFWAMRLRQVLRQAGSVANAVLVACKTVLRSTLNSGNWLKFWKIVLLCLTFERQVAKSIRTLELNFNFLNGRAAYGPTADCYSGVWEQATRHAAKCSR